MKALLKKLTRSSANPEKLSLTLKGLLAGLLPLIYFFTNANGLDVSQGELVEIADELVAITVGGYSLLLTALGLARKIYYLFK